MGVGLGQGDDLGRGALKGIPRGSACSPSFGRLGRRARGRCHLGRCHLAPFPSSFPSSFPFPCRFPCRLAALERRLLGGVPDGWRLEGWRLRGWRVLALSLGRCSFRGGCRRDQGRWRRAPQGRCGRDEGRCPCRRRRRGPSVFRRRRRGGALLGREFLCRLPVFGAWLG